MLDFDSSPQAGGENPEREEQQNSDDYYDFIAAALSSRVGFQVGLPGYRQLSRGNNASRHDETFMDKVLGAPGRVVETANSTCA